MVTTEIYVLLISVNVVQLVTVNRKTGRPVQTEERERDCFHRNLNSIQSLSDSKVTQWRVYIRMLWYNSAHYATKPAKCSYTDYRLRDKPQ
jgi:hypothetical protein